ncbi:transcription factor bHLH67 isoform X1 [Cucumis melo var. makuwa]|uniref:Transcription factor bHLH67 isoform X1 n=2 Tax=Cucumis melo TaxID=3656 RepID=A0A5D3DAW7_CUCMM|nr:transcription factor bHLH67 isoform X1 [Cucumis melo var. makuwa]TYK20747.1 transcription factor bHLH67 isoform X1 [Cucumis melo var. makuwa]
MFWVDMGSPSAHWLYGEYSETGCSEQEFSNLGFEESEEVCLLTSSLEDKIPFLQMLQSVESQSFKEPNFQSLLKLQHLNKPWEEGVSKIQELVELFSSPINSETKDQNQPPNSDRVFSECNQNQGLSQTQMTKFPPVIKERRKRKRSKPTKNKEEVESQRMTHIAVERNRRRQMNDHLNVIKSLIPTSYVQRGDQASIIGGAIDFVKELEQLLESLEALRKERKGAEGECKDEQSEVRVASNRRIGEGVCAELRSEVAEIEVTMIQTHVNLKIRCRKRQGQLLKVIVALEDLRLTVLHLNITSQTAATMLYSFNLKIEDECKLESEEQIAATVNQIFSFMNNGRLVNEAKGKFQAVQWQSLTMEEDPPFPPLFPIRKKEK